MHRPTIVPNIEPEKERVIEQPHPQFGEEVILGQVGALFARSDRFWEAAKQWRCSLVLASELVPCERKARELVSIYIDIGRNGLVEHVDRDMAAIGVMQFGQRMVWHEGGPPLSLTRAGEPRTKRPRFPQYARKLDALKRVLAAQCAVAECPSPPEEPYRWHSGTYERLDPVCCSAHRELDDLEQRRVRELLTYAMEIAERMEEPFDEECREGLTWREQHTWRRPLPPSPLNRAA